MRDLLVAELWFDVGVDILAVAARGGWAQGALLVLRQPDIQPLAQRHAAVLGELHIPIALDALVEFFRDRSLGVGVVVMEDGIAVFLVADDDARLPASVFALAHHAVTGRSSFCHLGHLLGVLATQTTTTLCVK